MANSFNKEEVVAFEDILEGFNDALVMSNAVSKYNTNQTSMERSNDTIWRPMPYIAQSFDGLDQSANFLAQTQLAVPHTIGFKKSSPWTMNALELRDALQENRLGQAAKQKLASDINIAVNNVASSQGTLVVKRTTAAIGFDDAALADTIMNEQGVSMGDRYLAWSSRDYNSAAGDLAKRQTLTGKPLTAYDKAYIGQVAGFESLKLDYFKNLATSTATGVTVTAANQYYTPVATVTSANGVNNVDNRYQTIGVTVTGSTIKVGDCITMAGVNAVHHITKEDTGQLKTFRVIALVTGAGATGTIQISPPIISAEGATPAEKQYQNVTATPAAGAAITFLNTVTAPANPFWHKDAIVLLPGRYSFPDNAGAAIIRGTTDQGIEVVMQKQYDIKTGVTNYRLDTLFGVTMSNPEMAGVMLFNQT